MARKPADRQEERIIHTIDPVYDADSVILILGTMPSPKSRAADFFYMHPQNRFWTVLAAVKGEPAPQGRAERLRFLLRHHIALWDTVASCQIRGAADSSIFEPIANDIRPILETAPIQGIFTTGKKAHEMYERHFLPITGRPDICLPSTSPANQAISLSRLVETYRQALETHGFAVVSAEAAARAAGVDRDSQP